MPGRDLYEALAGSYEFVMGPLPRRASPWPRHGPWRGILALAGTALLAAGLSSYWHAARPGSGSPALFSGSAVGRELASAWPGFLAYRAGESIAGHSPGDGALVLAGSSREAVQLARREASSRGGRTDPPPPAPRLPSTYQAVAGDTVAGLAARFGISAETIVWANGLQGEGQALQAGRGLTILPVPGVLYKVRKGDNLLGIALAFKVSLQEIALVNGLQTPDLLAIGQQLIIPGGRPLPSQAAPLQVPSLPGQPLDPQAARGQEIVDIAARFLGYRYTWGGQAPATGFDCSGFAWYVYGQAGIRLPHGLTGQLRAGPAVNRGELLPGDLVFFENTFQPGLSHVGIYAGGGRFVHAASEERGVATDSLGVPFWSTRYVGASRPWR